MRWSSPPEPIVQDPQEWFDWLTEAAGEPLWSIDLETFGPGITIVDDVWFTYVRNGDDLEFHVGDVETGELRWSMPTDTGSEYPWELWTHRVFETDEGPAVAVLHPFDFHGSGQDVQSLDIRTVREGEVLGTLRSTQVSGGAGLCAHQYLGCLQEWNDHELRFEIRVIDQYAVAYPPLRDGYGFTWSIGPELYIAENPQRQMNEVVRHDGEEVIWSLPLSEFGLDDVFSIDQVHSPTHFTSVDGQTVVSIQLSDAAPAYERASTFEAAPTVIAFDWASGEQLWSKRDAVLLDQNTYFTVPEGPIEWTVQEGMKILLSSGPRIDTRVDPLSGEEIWSTNLPRVDVEDTDPAPFSTSPFVTLFHAGDSWRYLDHRDGELHLAEPTHMFACYTLGDSLQKPPPFPAPANRRH